MTKPQLLLMTLGAIGLAHAQEPAAPSDTAATEFHAQVETLLKSVPAEVQGARIAHPELISAFYSQRSFRPAWTNAHTASELRRALKDSEADGLDPRDYHLPILEQLSGNGSSSWPPTRYCTPMRCCGSSITCRSGKWTRPRSIRTGTMGARSKSIDVSQKIEAAVASPDIYAEIEKLKPTHRMYRALKQELARIRLIAARGERVTVAPGKAIEVDTHDERVACIAHPVVDEWRSRCNTGLRHPISTTPTLQAAVRRFQERMGLAADGKVGARTIEELNVPIEDRIRQLRVNLDRGRVLLQDLPNEFVVVNIAAYWVYVVRGQEVVWNSRAQVGKTYRQTPMFRSAIDYLVLNPTWTVPPGIIRNDILPAARKDPASITRRGLRVLDAGGNEVDPASVDWSKFKSGNIPYTLRQDPGPKNALGRVKFMFPNSYSVYLHDTPAQ